MPKGLVSLKPGFHEFDGLDFDARGAVRLSSGRRAGWDGSFPDRLEGIPVDRQGLRLQFLDAAVLPETNGTLIGRHCVNCADGQPAEAVAFSWTDETSKNATYG